MLRRSASVLALMAVLQGGAAWSQTLTEALSEAYRTNPTLQAQRAQQRATDEQASQARSNWRPTITFDASFARQITDSQGAQIFAGQVIETDFRQEQDQRSFGLNYSQNLFRGFRNFNEVAQADATVEAGSAQLFSTEQQVLLDTTTAFFDVILQRETVRLRQNNVDVLTRQLEAAQDRFRVGEITRTDVAQAEARLALAVSQLVQSQADAQRAEAIYEQQVGKTPGALVSPEARPALPDAIDDAVNRAVGRNPNVVAARATERASDKGIEVAKGALLPTVSLQANATDSNSDPINFRATTQQSDFVFDTDTRSLSLAARLTLPIYQSGAAYSRIRQARENNNRDRIRVAEQERLITQQAISSFQSYEAAKATIISSEEQVRANEIAFEGVEQEALVGSRTVLDVLDAEQELLNSRVQLVTAVRNEQVAAYTLLAAVGELTARDLELPVAYYDPEVNYDRVKWKFVGWNGPTAKPAGVGDARLDYDDDDTFRPAGESRRLTILPLTGDDEKDLQDE